MDNSLESRLKKRIETAKKLEKIKDIPPLPKVIFEVNRLLKSEKTAPNELAGVIGKDSGLTTKILRIANSPLYGLQRQVSSIEFAVLVLGLSEISQLVTAISLSDSIRGGSNPNFDYESFWKHSAMVGVGAKEVARQLGFVEVATDAFVAGMLHDLGMQILIKYFPSEFNTIVQTANFTGKSFVEVELDVLGLSHQEMGKFLGERWNLPSALCNAMGFHHTPSNAKSDWELLAVVNLTVYMLERMQIAPFFWDRDVKVNEKVLEHFELNSEELLNAFIDRNKEQFADAAEHLKL